MSHPKSESETIKSLQKEIKKLKADLKQADLANGRLLRNQERIEDLEDSRSRREDWLRKAKADAGYSATVSFDVVWAEALAALLEKRKAT